MQNRLAKKPSCEVSASVNRSKVDARRSFQGKAPVSMRIFAQISSGAINAFLLLQLPCNLEASCNPLFEGADPDILFANNKYWIYPTGTGEGQEAYVYSSSDLQSWQKQGPVFALKNAKWIESDRTKKHYLWAPGILQSRNKFYYYYSVGPQNPTPSRIGVAVSSQPDGPFIDSGKALITGDPKFEAIDAMVFRDPKTKKHFLYCGGSAGCKLKVFELNNDLISIKQEIPVQTPRDFTEGPFVHYHNGIYYLSYSTGRWNDDSYHVSYSTSSSPIGPWKFEGIIVRSDNRHAGPGHHSVIKTPNTNNWYIVYHRWNAAKADKKMPNERSIAIDKLEFLPDGKIKPASMTD
jgi:beta-xylosidase